MVKRDKYLPLQRNRLCPRWQEEFPGFSRDVIGIFVISPYF